MFILNWIRQYYEMKINLQEKKLELRVCQSCETLKRQLEISNHEKSILLDRLMERPKELEIVRSENPQPIIPKVVPWNIRRQMLEAEDRERSKLLKKSTEELEKEINIASERKEN